ncbi:MAG: GyrI-like domain-containing protein [Gammaproteobacteria bacterium]|jgi:predicted transcriptional regulator YdeE
MMDIREQTIETMKVVGIKTATSKTLESNPETSKIPALWQTFFSEDIAARIPRSVNHETIYGVYTAYDPEQRGNYHVIVGSEVEKVTAPPNDMVAVEVPAGRYLVFSQQGEVPEVIYSAWQYIWDFFANDVSYQRLYTTDFELYRMDDTSHIEIYIAIASP